jgi:septal ring factor EnvC (AmiA/AmiB activator)
MKIRRWIIIGAIILVALLIFGLFYSQGYFSGVSWQGFTILAAALAAPFQFIFGKAKQMTQTENFLKQNEAKQKEEKVHREQYDQMIADREKKLKELDKDIELLKTKVELVDQKREKVHEEVQNMTPQQKTKEAQDLWGS